MDFFLKKHFSRIDQRHIKYISFKSVSCSVHKVALTEELLGGGKGGEAAQWLRSLTAFPECPGSIPSPFVVASQESVMPVPGDPLPSSGLFRHIVHRQTRKTPIYIKIIEIFWGKKKRER